jgi:transcription-repair coupling factor (superfamily II helicase)
VSKKRFVCLKSTNYVSDFQLDTDQELMFPDDYINQTTERLTLYQDLSKIEDEAHLIIFEQQLLDRFGPLPKQAQSLLMSVRLKWLCIHLGIEKLILRDKKLIGYFKETLGDLVKDVKISKKLTSSPACLAVGEGAMDIRMERFLIEQKQLSAASSKILEVNPNHKIVKKILSQIDSTEHEEENKQLVHLLFDQACVIEGQPVEDAAAFARRLNYFLEKANV